MPRDISLKKEIIKLDSSRNCELCDGPLLSNNSTGICRTLPGCKTEDDKRRGIERPVPVIKKPKPPKGTGKKDTRAHRPTVLLAEDGIIDPIAVYIAVNGVRKIAMTHRERVEAVRQMLTRGSSIREMCDNLHVQPGVVRSILDELGFECVRNEHIAGSKIMVILPKDRVRGPKILAQGPAPVSS
jgi:hypothetical protein